MCAAAQSSRQGLLVVISGPSGAGKTTIARAVEERLNAVFSVSATTRPPADSDIEGRDYFFVTDEEFRGMVDRGEMLEHARVFGKYWYGTPRRPVERALADSRLVILEIDVQGGAQVRRSMPDALLIFILPPTDQALYERLLKRGRDDENGIDRRLEEAKDEIEAARDLYDIFIVNDDLDRAIDETCAAIERAQKTSI